MARGRVLAASLAFSLLVNVLSIPIDGVRLRRQVFSNEVESRDVATNSITIQVPSTSTEDPFSLDDDDFDEPMYPSPTTNGGGSSIFSLLNLASALFPSSSSASILRNVIRQIVLQNRIPFIKHRNDKIDNVIIIDDIHNLKPFQRQESEEDTHENSEDSHEHSKNTHNNSEDNHENSVDTHENSEDTHENSKDTHENSEDTYETSEDTYEISEDTYENSEEDDNSESHSDENNAAENSIEVETIDKENSNNSKQDSNGSGDGTDYDSDEPPEGDGQGGGILGILASLSGGEDGESDLGTLIAAVSGIVVNLSGDGFDLNSLIGSALGLFVGLLSEGEENPGEIIASYLLTSLDTITGGGAKNNGAFFGNFLSKLVKGTSAAEEPESEEDSEDKKPQMKDSASFFGSLIMSLLGEMSGGSSHPW